MVAIAHTSTKLKHTRFCTMKILLSYNYYHASSFYSAHSSMLNVCDNNVYDARMCTSFYYSTDKCTGWLCCGSTPKDGLPNPRGSLVNKIPSHTTEQTNQEVQQEHHHSQHTSNQVSNA